MQETKYASRKDSIEFVEQLKNYFQSAEAEDFALFLQDLWKWKENIKAERLTHGTP